MGRYISCKIGEEYETVWKYGFGVQNSEMYRICEELGIGEYYWVRYSGTEEDPQYEYVSEDEMEDVDGDILILNRQDLDKLEQKIHLLKNSTPADTDQWFIAMLETIRDFMREHSEQDQFIFEGEF
jgi:hypothetical protein